MYNSLEVGTWLYLKLHSYAGALTFLLLTVFTTKINICSDFFPST